jgi:carbon dioxide concentrating mechanism protein CcmL
MKMVKVIGSVTSTVKDSSLDGFKLLFVQSVNIELKGKKEYFIAVDTIGLGEEEIALMVTGSTAKKTEITKDRNVDGTLVAKVERIDLN